MNILALKIGYLVNKRLAPSVKRDEPLLKYQINLEWVFCLPGQ
jgi:hypothetical protein